MKRKMQNFLISYRGRPTSIHHMKFRNRLIQIMALHVLRKIAKNSEHRLKIFGTFKYFLY